MLHQKLIVVNGHRILLIPDSNIFYYLNTIREDEVLHQIVKFIIQALNIFKVWLSKEVIREVPPSFMKRVREALESIIPVEECPITNNKLRDTIKEDCGIQIGEADCIMQIVVLNMLDDAVKNRKRVFFLSPKFLTNDTDALECRYAKDFSIPWVTVHFIIFQTFGIKLPK